jgi:hypothetical protein
VVSKIVYFLGRWEGMGYNDIVGSPIHACTQAAEFNVTSLARHRC